MVLSEESKPRLQLSDELVHSVSVRVHAKGRYEQWSKRASSALPLAARSLTFGYPDFAVLFSSRSMCSQTASTGSTHGRDPGPLRSGSPGRHSSPHKRGWF